MRQYAKAQRQVAAAQHLPGEMRDVLPGGDPVALTLDA
jgi:hypothetical protein